MEEFSSDRCLLSPLRNDDRDDVGRLYANQDVRRFLGGSLVHEGFNRRFEDLRAHSTAKIWTIRLKSTSLFVGIIGIDKHHDGQDQEVSYQLLPEFWGQGYAREAVSAVIEYAAAVMMLTSIVAETQCANHASRRLLERVGMEPVRTLSRFGEDQIIYRRRFSL